MKSIVINQTTRKRIKGLETLLGRLAGLHADLRRVIDLKIQFMRLSDIEGIQESVSSEAGVIQKIAEQEGLRRQLIRAIAKELSIQPKGRMLSVGELCEHIDSETAEKLKDGVKRLREEVVATAERNRIATSIAETVLGHMGRVFDAMTRSTRIDVNSYSHKGTRTDVSLRPVLDAVG